MAQMAYMADPIQPVQLDLSKPMLDAMRTMVQIVDAYSMGVGVIPPRIEVRVVPSTAEKLANDPTPECFGPNRAVYIQAVVKDHRRQRA